AAAPAASAHTGEHAIEIGTHLGTYDLVDDGAHLLLHFLAHLGGEIAVGGRGPHTGRTPTPMRGGAGLLAPRIVRHRRDIETLLNRRGGEALFARGLENVLALLVGIPLARAPCLLRHTQPPSGLIPLQRPRGL